MISLCNHQHNTRSKVLPDTFCDRMDWFKYSFFPYTISKWDKLPLGICHSNSIPVYKNALLKRIRPSIKCL